MDANALQGALDDFVDQLGRLTAVDWGFVVVAVAAGFCWAWVMGGPREETSSNGRAPTALAVAVVAGIASTLALTFLGDIVEL
jgi:hypothetical protein